MRFECLHWGLGVIILVFEDLDVVVVIDVRYFIEVIVVFCVYGDVFVIGCDCGVKGCVFLRGV